MNRKGRVVAAFPATGKSHCATMVTGIADSDSSCFSRHPDWPANYIAHIDVVRRTGLGLVLVSTHAEVRRALVDSGIDFTLVYPAVELREEYRARMRARGSPSSLIRTVCDEIWESALAECAATRDCEHIVLGSGEFLIDVLMPEDR